MGRTKIPARLPSLEAVAAPVGYPIGPVAGNQKVAAPRDLLQLVAANCVMHNTMRIALTRNMSVAIGGVNRLPARKGRKARAHRGVIGILVQPYCICNNCREQRVRRSKSRAGLGLVSPLHTSCGN